MPTILQRIAKGEESAILDCIDEYGDLVWRLAMRYLRTRENAEDATQEVFVAIWLTAGRFDPARGSEPSWVATIAHRRLTDYARSPKWHRAVSAEQAPPAQAENPNGNKWTRHDEPIVRALNVLSGEERETVWLSIAAGLSHAQIAEALDVPLGTVKTRLRRAIGRLRELMYDSATGATSAAEGGAA